MSLFAYIRKEYPASTLEQLKILNNYQCEEVFIEEADIASEDELDLLLSIIKPHDQLIVYDLRVFAKNIKSFKQLLEELSELEIRLISFKDKIDTHLSVNFYTDVIKVLEMEERHRGYVIKMSIEQAKSEGRITGRPKVKKDVVNQIVFLFENKGKSMREIAEICDVSLGTVHKYLRTTKNASE